MHVHIHVQPPSVPQLKTSAKLLITHCPLSSLCSCINHVFFFSSFLAVYKATAYRGIPCVVLVIDGLVTYVGAPQEQFRLTLDEAIETIALQTSKEA